MLEICKICANKTRGSSGWVTCVTDLDRVLIITPAHCLLYLTADNKICMLFYWLKYDAGR